MNRRAATTLAACVALGCSNPGEAASMEAFSQLSDDVERDGWVDTAHTVAGDGATSFESDQTDLRQGPGIARPSQPRFYERGFDTGTLTSMQGEHLLSLSRFRGLVSTRVTGSDAPRVEATLPVGGLPVGLVVSEGVAAVLVVDRIDAECVAGVCQEKQTSRVVLVDVQDPARPRRLGEQEFGGTLSAARQVGSVLHVLTRRIVDCLSCLQAPNIDFTWLAFDRSTPSELAPPRLTRLGGPASFADGQLVVLSPGVYGGDTAPELRLAQLSQPEPMLSAPVPLQGSVARVNLSGDRLRLMDSGEPLTIETFALGSGTPILLGRGRLALPEGESLRLLGVEGDRAVAMLEPAGQLALIDLSDPGAPRILSLLELDVAESNSTFAGDRALVIGRSTLAADAAPEDVVARGPQALVLVDIADPAAPRVLDRVTLGSFDSEHAGLLALRGERAVLSYYEEFPTWLAGAKPEDGDCARSIRRLLGYDISSGRLAPAFAFDGLDADAQVEARGDEWWVASSVSVSRYVEGSGAAPSARIELTRSVERLRALSGGVALFVHDFASNAPTLELASDASPLDAPQTLDIATAIGLPRVGCDERRRWGAPVMERGSELYALRFHLPSSGVGTAAATLHVLDAPPMSAPPLPLQPSLSRSLELDPLEPGEDYLGAIQTDASLLIARGRRDDAPLQPGFDPSSLLVIGNTDPTLPDQPPDSIGGASYTKKEGLHRDAKLSYDVIDLSDPAAPVHAARLDIEPALATAGFFRALRGLTRDTAWGFHIEGLAAGPAVSSGSIIAGQHSEQAANGLYRFYLDRFDLSDPYSPVQLPPVEIPGSVLGFDAATGELVTLEVLRLRAPAGSRACEGLTPPAREGCTIARRALNALVVDEARATRVGRLLLDTDERQVVGLAVSNTMVYYATRASEPANGLVGPLPPRELSIERVVLRDERFERLPSFDVVSAFDGEPMAWDNFAARGDRVLWSSSGQLLVVDFAGAEPSAEVHDIGPWGCGSLDLGGNTAYCAQGQAGYVAVPLGEP